MWLRLESDLFSNPDIQDLLEYSGELGLTIFVFALCQAKLKNQGGSLPQKAWTERHIGRALFKKNYDSIKKAMLEIENLELVISDEDGYFINNWSKYQPDPSNAERQSRFRERKKSNVTGRYVTLRNGSNGDKQTNKTVQRQDKRQLTSQRLVRPGKSTPPWEAYKEAYHYRYGVDPIRNASTNAMLCKLVDRVGATAAPHVAAWYLKSNYSYYVGRKHPVNALLADCEKLHTEWKTQTHTTQSGAREADRLQDQGQKWQKTIEKLGEE